MTCLKFRTFIIVQLVCHINKLLFYLHFKMLLKHNYLNIYSWLFTRYASNTTPPRFNYCNCFRVQIRWCVWSSNLLIEKCTIILFTVNTYIFCWFPLSVVYYYTSITFCVLLIDRPLLYIIKCLCHKTYCTVYSVEWGEWRHGHNLSSGLGSHRRMPALTSGFLDCVYDGNRLPRFFDQHIRWCQFI